MSTPIMTWVLPCKPRTVRVCSSGPSPLRGSRGFRESVVRRRHLQTHQHDKPKPPHSGMTRLLEVLTEVLTPNGGPIMTATVSTQPGYQVVNPATGAAGQSFDFATDAEVETALAASDEAYRSWRDLPISERARVVTRGGEPF